MAEKWKGVIGLESKYQVSSKGRVRSLNYEVEKTNTSNYINKGRILKQSKNAGYLRVCIGGKPRYVHHLVCESFLGHKVNGHDKVIDHINEDKFDNNIENLRIVSNRQNCNRKPKGKSSLLGAFYRSNRNKWFSRIEINGKYKYLGSFESDKEAHERYCLELKRINQCPI